MDEQNSKPHCIKACIINCIDYRVQQTFYEWLQTHHMLGSTDIIEIAGSSRDLAKPLKPQDQSELLRNIDISIKLHKPNSIIIFDHQDCGGYAQDKTIQSGLIKEEDMKQHAQYAQKAKELLQETYPNLEIKTFYITLDHKIFLI